MRPTPERSPRGGNAPPPADGAASRARLARRLGPFDVTMLVMGGIVGAGIFINPYVVARTVTTPGLILGAWLAGGLVALAAAFLWAELGAALPEAGGQYAYLREAFHPMAAFLYGWALLLVIQSGGMAAVAVTFGLYFRELTGTSVSASVVAVLALAALAAVNCLGVRAGSRLQSLLMLAKIGAILLLILCGTALVEPFSWSLRPLVDRPPSAGLLAAMAAAMVPVLFSYGGWQTASFVAGEVRRPTRTLPVALLVGVGGVVALYLGVNVVYVRALGPEGLAATTTPASAVMREALGPAGARLIAGGIAVSTLGFLSQGMLAAPRVYYAMADDGLFFRFVGRVHPTSRVPRFAIALQALLAAIVAASGRYDQILNYVVSIDWIFFGLTAAAVFPFRRRAGVRESRFRTPGHPYVTILFVLVSWSIAASTIVQFPENAGIGVGLLLAGVPAYALWSARRKGRREEEPFS